MTALIMFLCLAIGFGLGYGVCKEFYPAEIKDRTKRKKVREVLEESMGSVMFDVTVEQIVRANFGESKVVIFSGGRKYEDIMDSEDITLLGIRPGTKVDVILGAGDSFIIVKVH